MSMPRSPATLPRACAAALVLLGAAALAYVLPSGAILRRVAAARDELQLTSLKVEGAFTFSGPLAREAAAVLGRDFEGPELQIDGLLYVKVPGRCRAEVAPLEGSRLAVVTADRKQRVEGTELPPLTVALKEICALLAGRYASEAQGAAVLERHLRGLGVELGKATTLARFGGQVAYVLGDAAEGQPQLWVYKDVFHPARVRFTDATGTSWDVRFQDYASPATGAWIPRSFEVWRGGERVLRFNAFRSDSRAPIKEGLLTL